MSEFTNKSKQRIENLTNYFVGLLNKENGTSLLKKYEILQTQFLPEDVLIVFDYAFELQFDIEEIKSASNKLFNILYKQFNEPEIINPKEDTLLYYLILNNLGLKKLLLETKRYIKQANTTVSISVISELKKNFEIILSFTSHYTLFENIIFPEIEKKWKETKCLKILWSLHDDVRKNLKKTLEIINSKVFNIQEFNKYSSLAYFNINTIIFREERILFPIMLKSFENEELDNMLSEASEFELNFVKIPENKIRNTKKIDENFKIKFNTGELYLDQIELIFNNLPIDLTFVDENNKVCFFSNPKHRIFPRTKAIIGRSVQNCHPHESIETVNQIINSFKEGEKESASFWIHLGGQFVLIQYFAVRDEQNNYRGVLEVSQEITAIQQLTGDKKLLDW